MKIDGYNLAREMRFAKSLYGDLPKPVLRALRELIIRHELSVTSGFIVRPDFSWANCLIRYGLKPASSRLLSMLSLPLPRYADGESHQPSSSKALRIDRSHRFSNFLCELKCVP